MIWGDEGEVRSFKDRWSGGMDHYIGWLKERVEEMHRILKPTGSIFLHCDWHANSWIRVEILDKLFGSSNFRGEIIWQRTGVHNDAKKKLAVVSDTIWYYSKGSKITWHPIYSDQSEEDIEIRYRFTDENGRRYQSGPMDSPNPRPNLMFEWKGFPPPAKGWRFSKEMMEELDARGEIIYPSDVNGRLRRRDVFDESKGALIGKPLGRCQEPSGPLPRSASATQRKKPEALMEHHPHGQQRR
ncbi:MAG: site-specific DNA-methyltransferase [Flavobacteriales bacterium]|nr:site-specific DNA-methyltransferase [Flavobacteriales bacterium]